MDIYQNAQQSVFLEIVGCYNAYLHDSIYLNF